MGICLNRSSVKIVTGPAVMWVIVLLLLVGLASLEGLLDMLDAWGNDGDVTYINKRRTKGDPFYLCMMSIVSRDIKGNQHKGSRHPQTCNTPWHAHHILLPADETCHLSGSFLISK